MPIHRRRAIELGRDTVAIIERGHYTMSDGRRVDIAASVATSRRETLGYPPGERPRLGMPAFESTEIHVVDEDALSVARRSVELRRGSGVAQTERCQQSSSTEPMVLNFASARSPGGGFLGGGRAQEESLARSSTLFACLRNHPMYELHRQRRTHGLYSDYAIYSPGVAVFRDHGGELLETPFLCTFITCAAVNASARRMTRERAATAMAARIDKVLTISSHHGHDTLILGAWGCGAFGNDPSTVAELFHDALVHRFDKHFATVVFAIVDWSDDRRFIGPFSHRFRSQ